MWGRSVGVKYSIQLVIFTVHINPFRVETYRISKFLFLVLSISFLFVNLGYCWKRTKTNWRVISRVFQQQTYFAVWNMYIPMVNHSWKYMCLMDIQNDQHPMWQKAVVDLKVTESSPSAFGGWSASMRALLVQCVSEHKIHSIIRNC